LFNFSKTERVAMAIDHIRHETEDMRLSRDAGDHVSRPQGKGAR
jgi:hypothetical protein